jgi:hypothetical protein
MPSAGVGISWVANGSDLDDNTKVHQFELPGEIDVSPARETSDWAIFIGIKDLGDTTELGMGISFWLNGKKVVPVEYESETVGDTPTTFAWFKTRVRPSDKLRIRVEVVHHATRTWN